MAASKNGSRFSAARRGKGGVRLRVRAWAAGFGQIFRLDLRGGLVLVADLVVNFPAMNRNCSGGRDSQPHLVPANIDNPHLDVVADHDAVVPLTS
jgi:hypothetical protein